jgi:selenocysteine lyase/cysteine desulfurase
MHDIRDYIGDTDIFPVLKDWIFFNHAGVSPMPRFVTDAIRKHLDESETRGYLATTWYHDIELMRQTAAGLINAHRDEIAFVKNTSEGLSIVAKGLEWQWGDRIVTTGVEYPANVYPWMEVARNHGAKLIMVPEETDASGRRAVPIEKILAEAEDPRTKIVSLSHVEYASGQRHNLERIGAFCREHHKLFCVDAIQTIGVLSVDVQQMKIDFLSADGHKWMLGPEGAGFFYCRREMIERTRPLMIGWMNVIDAQNYGDYNFTLKSDAGRFECGTWNVPGLLGLKAALDVLKEIGIDPITNRVKALTDRLIKQVETRGYSVISPRGLGQWSASVCFTSPVHNHEQIVRTMRKEHHVELAFREGRLRASPHFYNTEAQVDRMVELLPGH